MGKRQGTSGAKSKHKAQIDKKRSDARPDRPRGGANARDHQARRAFLAEVGSETLKIASDGVYKAGRSGQRVTIGPAADAARAGTVYYAPDDHPEHEADRALQGMKAACECDAAQHAMIVDEGDGGEPSSTTGGSPVVRDEMDVEEDTDGASTTVGTDPPAVVEVKEGEVIASTTSSPPSARACEPVRAPFERTVITVRNESTVAAVLRLCKAYRYEDGAPYDRVGALNFASAKNPGGGVRSGAQAQEEAICRCSALYRCLVSGPGYAVNKNARGFGGVYSDHITFSPLVPVFRTDDGLLLEAEEVCRVSFVSSAAPNRKAAARKLTKEVSAALRRRVERILALFYLNGCDVLVLGAYGCGVFGNDPDEVARLFRHFLQGKYRGCFKHVCFAILERGRSQNIPYFIDVLEDMEGYRMT